MAKIIITLKEKKMSELQLKKEITSIGRDEKNDVYLKNPSVSRKHCQIVKKGRMFYIEDLDSTNGTYVNDEMILWRKGLNDDDEIMVGKYTLIFKDAVQEKKNISEKLMPEFLDSTIKVSRKKS